MGGDNGGDSTTSSSSDSSDDTRIGQLSTPVPDDASGVGLSMVIVTGVLLAFGYYGVIGVSEHGFGQAIPSPFFLLAIALIFVIELLRRRSFTAREVASAVGVTAIYGILVVFALEGGAYLWENPDAALDDFLGVAVLAVSLVIAAIVYVVYLTATESTTA